LKQGRCRHRHLPNTSYPSRRPPLREVSWIKGGSSRWINDQSTTDGFSWQEGYGAFTVSISQVPRVRKYILNQEEHHKKVSFVQEFTGLLKKNGVAFNPKDFD